MTKAAIKELEDKLAAMDSKLEDAVNSMKLMKQMMLDALNKLEKAGGQQGHFQGQTSGSTMSDLSIEAPIIGTPANSLRAMSTDHLLSVQPNKVYFQFKLRMKSSCLIQLSNKRDECIAFKVKTTNPSKYCVKPNRSVVFPGTTCIVELKMQAPKEAPADMECKDKFLIQCVEVPHDIKDLAEVFNKAEGNAFKEIKLRVVYVPVKPHIPVPEGSKEGLPARLSAHESGHRNASNEMTRLLEESKQKSKAFFKTHPFSFVFGCLRRFGNKIKIKTE